MAKILYTPLMVQVFYLTHMLYCVYFILLIFHAPEFWKWFLFPAIIWVAEGIYRYRMSPILCPIRILYSIKSEHHIMHTGTAN